ncbi:MAG: tRNA sulfurtransferase [Candidatus Hadarchaeaceae archaeon]
MAFTVIVRYGELALKSEPVRKRFEKTLINSIKRSLREIPHKIRNERGRIFVDTTAMAKTIKIISRIPGITSISPAVMTTAEIDAIKDKVTSIAKKILKPNMSFAVRTTRIGKHSFSSKDINVAIGSHILSLKKDVKVDLTHPDVVISIEVRGKDAYIFSETIEGIGGLPVGTQGRVVAVLSGNKRDAVAAFVILKRGCMITPLIFDINGDKNHHLTKQKVSQARKLSLFGADDSIWIFPLKQVLNLVQKKTDYKFYFFIRKRCELRAAEIIARKIAAEAVVTGDDAEYIAAMLLPKLNFIDAVCRLSVLRPLSCLEKDEIESIGLKIGLKMAKKSKHYRPVADDTISAEEILKQEMRINIEKIIDDASKKIRKIKVR